jgi:hypothetical protein
MASKRHYRKKHCTNRVSGEPKQAYALRSDAEAHAARINARQAQRVVAYRCDFGHGWHVGVPAGGLARHDKLRFTA